MNTTWPFDQPENCAVVSMRQIMTGGLPVLLVVHDEDDGGWQFLTGGECRMEDALLVSFKAVVAKDPGLLALAGLPIGWQAWRKQSSSPWVRVKSAAES